MNKVSLCIDVGIRNLSMCIMTKNTCSSEKTSQYKILLWGVYNVLSEIDDNHKCQGILKNGKECGKKCKMKYAPVNSSLEIFTCKKHFPKDISPTKVNMFKKKNVKNYALQDIAKATINKVQELYDSNFDVFNMVNSICIELQPKQNNSMKFVSHIIYGKLTDIFLCGSLREPVPIKFVKASEKLKALYEGPPLVCHLKGAYAKRKWMSLKYTEWFLENKFCEKDNWLKLFLEEQSPDMGDTALMAMNDLGGKKKK